MAVYYNEIDPKAAAWLRELIKQGHIADGVVDERSIEDVSPSELDGFAQCHFFAGIGGWSLALRMAGWPDDAPVWTGSCPCQPFSTAGKRAGLADERHLWPAFFHLIQQRKPERVYGEQVASALDWLDLVQTDMEATGYAFAAADLSAASIDAPHIRQRLYWVADNCGKGFSQQQGIGSISRQATDGNSRQDFNGGRGLGVANSNGREARSEAAPSARYRNPFDAADWQYLECRDGFRRPTQPGVQPLANGIPARVVRLRGYGNAIVPQVAAALIEATT